MNTNKDEHLYIAALQAQIAGLESNVHQGVVNITQLQARIAELMDSGRKIIESEMSRTEEVISLRDRVSVLEAQLAASNEDRDELRFTNHVDELEREVNRLSAQADTSANDMCMLTDDFGCTVRKAQTAEVARLQAQLAAQAGQEPIAWLATDLDGRGDVGFTKDTAKSRGGEGCTEFIALYDAPPAPANSLAIVQAALEAAKQAVADRACGLEIFVENATDAISDLDQQTILNGMK